MADRGNQFVLGVFVATFLYSLLVLRSIRVRDGGSGNYFVPHLAVNVAMLLAVLAIGVLVYFIHHISDSVQIWTLARQVRTDLLGVVDRLYPERIGEPPGTSRTPPAGKTSPTGSMSTVSRWRRRRPGTSKVSTRRTCSRWPANTT